MKIYDGGLAVDDRGAVTFVNDFDFKGVKRFYMVQNHAKGFVRAWHFHERESKYVLVVRGTILLGVLKPEADPVIINKFVLSDKKPQVLHIPAGYANGFKALTDNAQIIFFSTSTLEESRGDDIRYPFDKWNIWKEDFR